MRTSPSSASTSRERTCGAVATVCAYGMRPSRTLADVLDGVVAQQENYRKSGFELAYANVRFSGTVAAPDAPRANVVTLADVPLPTVEAYDATVFPAQRTAFLRA